MLMQDIKRGLTSISFWIGVLAFAVGMICFTSQDLLYGQEATPLYAFDNAFSGEIPYLPALLCVLPLGTAFYDEWNSMYYRFAISRSGWRRYTTSRILSSALLGGLIVMLPALIALLYCYIQYEPLPRDTMDSSFFGMLYRFPMMRMWVPYNESAIRTMSALQYARLEGWYSVAWMLRFFLFGACWAQLGLAISAWADDWAIILVSPLVLFMILEWAANRFGTPYLAARSLIAHGGELLMYPYWVTAVLPLAWGAIVIIIFILGMRRRKRLG